MKNTTLALILALVVLISMMVRVQSVKSSSKTIVVPEDYTTIQDAVDHASDGDTVLVKKGIYPIDENNTIVIGKTLSLRGEDPANTVIYGGSTNPYDKGTAIRLAAPAIAISGFTITNFRVAITVANYYGEPYPSGCRIIDNNIVNNSEGIRPQRNDLLISGNNITKNNGGITGYNTENVVITGNDISENDYGINIGTCRNITVTENKISHNTGGLNLCYFGPHTVCGNNITNNDWGIRFAEGCANATVHSNTIKQNHVGIALLIFPNAGDIVVSGAGNKVFHNILANNTEQVIQVESPYNYPPTTSMGTDIVSWDNGTIGNFWDDYFGLDENANGIGDTPYTIDKDNKDNFPLMMPYGGLPSPNSTASPSATPSQEKTPPATLEPRPNPEIPTVLLLFVASVGIAFAVTGLFLYYKRKN